MALNDAIEDHKTGDYVVTRTQGGTWSKGRQVNGTDSTFPISASVQPMGDELMDLPEGQTREDVRVIYTVTELITRRRGTPATPPADDAGRIDADRITIDGDMYRVFKVEKWDHWGETHYRAWAHRLLP